MRTSTRIRSAKWSLRCFDAVGAGGALARVSGGAWRRQVKLLQDMQKEIEPEGEKEEEAFEKFMCYCLPRLTVHAELQRSNMNYECV